MELTEKEIFDILGIEEENRENSKYLLAEYRWLESKDVCQGATIWLNGDFGSYVKGIIVLRTEHLIAVKRFTEKDAMSVAREDLEIGVSCAIDYLEKKYDVDTTTFYTINALGERMPEHEDELCLLARDWLYKELGISEIMEKAYDKYWN